MFNSEWANQIPMLRFLIHYEWPTILRNIRNLTTTINTTSDTYLTEAEEDHLFSHTGRWDASHSNRPTARSHFYCRCHPGVAADEVRESPLQSLYKLKSSSLDRGPPVSYPTWICSPQDLKPERDMAWQVIVWWSIHPENLMRFDEITRSWWIIESQHWFWMPWTCTATLIQGLRYPGQWPWGPP